MPFFICVAPTILSGLGFKGTKSSIEVMPQAFALFKKEDEFLSCLDHEFVHTRQHYNDPESYLVRVFEVIAQNSTVTRTMALREIEAYEEQLSKIRSGHRQVSQEFVDRAEKRLRNYVNIANQNGWQGINEFLKNFVDISKKLESPLEKITLQ